MKRTLLKLSVLSTLTLSSFNTQAREIIFDAEGTKRFYSIPFIEQAWFQEKFPGWLENINSVNFHNPYIPTGIYFDREFDDYSKDFAIVFEGWQNRVPKDFDSRFLPKYDPEFETAYKLSTGKELSSLSAFEVHKLDKQYYIDLYQEAFKRQIESLHIEKLVIKNHCYNAPYTLRVQSTQYIDECKPFHSSDTHHSTFNESAYNFDTQTYKLDMSISNIPVEKVNFNNISDNGYNKIGELSIQLPLDIAEEMSKSNNLRIYLSYTLIDGKPLFKNTRNSYGEVHPITGIRVAGTNFEKITDISVSFLWDDNKAPYTIDKVSFKAVSK